LVAAASLLALSGGTALAAGVSTKRPSPVVSSPTIGFARPADPGAAASEAVQYPPPGSFSGDGEALALRIEADEPLPAGSGDIPYVKGELNSDEKTDSGDVAADRLGPVTGPKASDPTGAGQQYASNPEATCSYPSSQEKASQSYPLDGSDQQTAQSEVTCDQGPSVAGLAYSAAIGGNAGLTSNQELNHFGLPTLGDSGAASGSESMGPDPATADVDISASAAVTNFQFPGLFSVGSVQATGLSRASGRPGGASSTSHVIVSGLRIGAATISLSDAGVSLGSGPPVPVSAAQSLLDAFNQVASTSNCSLTLLRNPADYPQGPLFSRPPLPNRINPDGTDAGSTAAGFYLRCAVPDDLNPTNFKPLILNVLLGFVGTEARASVGSGADQPSSAVGSAGSAPGAGTGDSLQASSTPELGGPGIPGSTAIGGLPRVAAPSEERAVTPTANLLPGPLVGLDGPLEAAGGLLAILVGLAGACLLGPWRVPVAAAEELPVDAPPGEA
jgi:hypothetical protein